MAVTLVAVRVVVVSSIVVVVPSVTTVPPTVVVVSAAVVVVGVVVVGDVVVGLLVEVVDDVDVLVVAVAFFTAQCDSPHCWDPCPQLEGGK